MLKSICLSMMKNLFTRVVEFRSYFVITDFSPLSSWLLNEVENILGTRQVNDTHYNLFSVDRLDIDIGKKASYTICFRGFEKFNKLFE